MKLRSIIFPVILIVLVLSSGYIIWQLKQENQRLLKVGEEQSELLTGYANEATRERVLRRNLQKDLEQEQYNNKQLSEALSKCK